MLKRVKNLSKSNDERLKEFVISFPARQRGVVGELMSLFDDNPNGDYQGLYILKDRMGFSLGIYREEELEDVTERELALEAELATVLSIFPNKFQDQVLNPFVTDDVDHFIANEVVPDLRKKYKRQFESATKYALEN